MALNNNEPILVKESGTQVVLNQLVGTLFHVREKRVWHDVVVVLITLLGVHVAFAVSILVSPALPEIAGWVSFTILLPLILTPIKFGILPGALAGIMLIATIPLLRQSMGYSANLPSNLSQMLAVLTITIPIVTGLVAGTIRTLRRALDHEQMIKREAHHRIKNSLNLVFSLLNLAQDDEANNNETDVLRRAAGHVAGIAAVHDSLSQSSSFELIDLREHLERLGKHLEAAGHSEAVLNVKGTATPVSGRIAVAIGLVLNELITNARKHGAIGAETTEVTFLSSKSKDKLKMQVVQPNVRLPDSFSLDSASGMGLDIIRGVLEQYNGRIEIVEREPACYNVIVDRQTS